MTTIVTIDMGGTGATHAAGAREALSVPSMTDMGQSYAQANSGYAQANAAYGQANTARSDANTTFATINTTFGTVNTSLGTVNTNYQAAYVQANTARSDANTTFSTVNTTFGTINTNYQAAYAQANTARATANDAYAAANTKLATSGGSISGDLSITGNLTVQGNATTINVSNLSVNDSIILLAAGGTGDSLDVGFVGHIQRGATNTHVGLIRKATENRFYLFDNYEVEPTNNVIDVAGNNFTVGNLRLGIINANSYVTSAGLDVTGQANAAYGAANNRVLKAGDTMTGQLNVSSGGLLVTGNVGFGMPSPIFPLQVKTNTGTPPQALQLNTTDWTTTIGSAFQFGFGAATGNTYSEIRALSGGYNAWNNLVLQSGGGKVGIGTTNPQALLQVGSTATGYPSLDITGSQEPGLYLKFGIGYAQLYNSYGTIGLNAYLNGEGKSLSSSVLYFAGYNNTANAYLQLFDNKVHIAGDGKIGIGTTSPSRKFDVIGDSNSGIRLKQGSQIANALAANTFYSGLVFENQSTSHAWSMGYNQGATFSINWFDADANTFSNRLLIASGGAVGIGTTSPLSLLHVSSGTSGNSIIIIEADTDNNNEEDNPKLWFKADGGLTEAAIQKGDNTLDIISNVVSGSGIRFFVGANTITGTTDPITGANLQMAINSSGNVAIGTSTASTKFEINRFEPTNRTTFYDILTINADGNQSPYDGYGGGILFRGTTYSGGGNNVQGNRKWGQIGMYLNDSFDNFSGESMFFAVASDDRSDTLTTAMTIRYNGDVSIGTKTPNYSASNRGLLYVNGTTTALIGLGYGGTAGGYFYTDSSSTVLWSEGSRNFTIGTASSGPLIFTTSNSERIRITSTGTVGVGTATPETNILTVKSSTTTSYSGTGYTGANLALCLKANSTSTGDIAGIRFINSNASIEGVFGYVQTGSGLADFVFQGYGNASSYTEKMRITGTGNVGIGTNNPSKNLHIYTSGNEGLYVQGTGAGVWIDVKSASSELWSMGADSSGWGIYNRTDSAYRLVVENDGHLRPGADNALNLGTTSFRWANIYTADLNLSNRDSQNDIDGTWGEWTIQEGEEDLFLLNRRNGKKYKFMLKEIE